jgi:site-specific recombinase XerC
MTGEQQSNQKFFLGAHSNPGSYLSGKPRSEGVLLRTVQELPGHNDVSTTMFYTHVLNKLGVSVRSPLDG